MQPVDVDLTGRWVKTLNGTDVYDNGDGFIWHPIVNQWVYEPGLHTMPGLGPAVAPVIRKSQVTGGWPSLREAWSLKTTANTDTFILLRLWVLLVAVYLLIHAPIWVMAQGRWADSMWTGGLLAISAACCLWMIWFDHLWQVNRRKGKQVAVAAVAGYVGLQIAHHLRAIEHPDRRG